MNTKNPSDLLFEKYLRGQDISFEYEPELPETRNRIDYLIAHEAVGTVYCEVKQIEVPRPEGSFFMFDPYSPVRNHIHDGVKQFKGLADTVNALVFAAGPGSFINLDTPTTMLGAMYGDFAFRVPLSIGPDKPAGEITSGFTPGKGRMLPHGRPQNTRISAIVSLQNYYVRAKEGLAYLNTDDGRSKADRFRDLEEGRVSFPEYVPCVTVWENAFAKKRFPEDLFRGPMDARWSIKGEHQVLSFIGDDRKRLRIDKQVG